MAEGFAPEDYWEDPVEVWPDCRASLELFVSLQTQWHIVGGFGGGIRSGLRYEAVYPLLTASLVMTVKNGRSFSATCSTWSWQC